MFDNAFIKFSWYTSMALYDIDSPINVTSFPSHKDLALFNGIDSTMNSSSFDSSYNTLFSRNTTGMLSPMAAFIDALCSLGV